MSKVPGYDVAESIAQEFGISIGDLRIFATQHLEGIWPEGEGIGTSDVSIHLGLLARTEPDLLRSHAKRLRDARRLFDSP